MWRNSTCAYCLPKKIELNREYARRASLAQDLWIILQTLCPYWLGVLAAYTGALVFSLGAAYFLRFDFRVMGPVGREFLGFVPWIVWPQLILLVWRGQLRGLISYVGPAELRQTALALTLALVLQLGLLWLSGGRLAPRLSILLLDFILSCAALGGLRLGARLLRERFSERSTATPPRAGSAASPSSEPVSWARAWLAITWLMSARLAAWSASSTTIPAPGTRVLTASRSWGCPSAC